MRMEINIKPMPYDGKEAELAERGKKLLPRAVREFLRDTANPGQSGQKVPSAKTYGTSRYLDDIGSHFPGDPPLVARPSGRD